ncbi:hypothetical protein J3459_019465 [Metarhizium acridum]|nr:hypothetical protein J3459_019465 [Metarhizium acridum]
MTGVGKPSDYYTYKNTQRVWSLSASGPSNVTGNLKKRIFLLKSRKIEVPYEVNFQVDAVGDYRVDISGDHVNFFDPLDPIQE